MGLPLSNIRVLVEHVVPLLPNRGRCLLLGMPDVTCTPEALAALSAEFGVSLPPRPTGSGVFAALGFDVTVLDVSDYEGAAVVADMNLPLPDCLRGRFSLVFDPGTLEHVFDARAAIENVADALEVGGVVLHHSPLSGWANHGFYTFGPCFFHDWYNANGFRVVGTWIVDLGARLNGQDVNDAVSLPYDPMWRDSLGPGRWVQYVAAVKLADVEHAIPTQRRYKEHLWQNA